MDTPVQNIFNKIMDAGLYQGNLMCFSLANAVAGSVITEKEYLTAKAAIEMYICGAVTLGVALVHNGLPHEISDRIAVYKDWANRPKLTR